MRLIIAGSRTITDYTQLLGAITAHGITGVRVVVSGGARGVDQLGERWANANGIPIDRHLPNWAAHGTAAGPIRNLEMARCADALLLLWDGTSLGSANMLQCARNARLKVFALLTGAKEKQL